MPENLNPSSQAASAPASAALRDANAIYQTNKLAARVEGPEVDPEGKTIRFEELYNSEYLLLPDECEYQQYRILVRKIEYATKEEKTALHKGRILRGVTADILGYREQ